MNGVHDMGGMDGFGKVEPEADEPTFHEKWEGRVMAMVRAMGAAGAFNIDTSRFYRETLPPHIYLAQFLLPEMAAGARRQSGRQGFRDRFRDCCRPCERACKAVEAREIQPR
jgi:hypothetical protein